MTKHKFSPFIALLILVCTFFSKAVSGFVYGYINVSVVRYIVYGLFISFFIMAFIRRVMALSFNSGEIFSLLMCGLISVLALGKSLPPETLTFAGFWFLGVFLAHESDKSSSVIPPVLILLVTVLLRDMLLYRKIDLIFPFLNTIMVIIAGLAGFTAFWFSFKSTR